MKRQDLRLTVYWNRRKATLRESTNIFLNFLRKLKAYQPNLLGTWYGTGRSKSLRDKIVLEYECVKKQFSIKHKDDSYRDIGYTANIIYDEDYTYKMMDILISQGSSLVSNWCTINLPAEGDIYSYFKEPSHQLELIKLMINHWEPDYISIHDYNKDILPPFTDEKILEAIKENIIYLKT